MTIFTKALTSPEVLSKLKADGQVLVEVTTKRYYVLHKDDERALPELMTEWFVTYRGQRHAYRDGSHVGGADEVQAIRNLSDSGKPIDIHVHPTSITSHGLHTP